MFSLEVLDMLQPFHMRRFVHLRDQLAEYVFDIADHRSFDSDHLVDLCRVDIDVDFLGADRKSLRVTNDPVIEPAAEINDQVGLVERERGIGHAVHAREAGTQHVVFRER